MVSRKTTRRPFHTTTVYLPHADPVVYQCFPDRKAAGRFFCNYCYTTHRNWWHMRYEDYDADVMLCGECEYTSLTEMLEEA